MKRILICAAATAAVALTGAASAEAKGARLLGTPKNACSIMVSYGAGGYTSFGDCAGRLHADVAAFRFPSDEDPNVLLSLEQRCAQFEAMGVISYPFTFEEGPDWPFPVLTAQNREQCKRTLFTYHELASLFPEPEAG